MPSTILDNVKGSDFPKIWADLENILGEKIKHIL
jgi:hypothetical protein